MLTQEPCDRLQLKILLHGDDSSQEFSSLASHVEECERCQLALTELAAEESDWNEIPRLLEDMSTSDVGGQAKEDPMAIDLSPPRHPELMGRIGRYEIERLIGSGGMGFVYKAHDSELNRPIAIKTLAPHLASNATSRQRFAREGRAAAAVVNDHVVAIHGVETNDDVPFIVMHYVPGESLQERVDRSGPLPIREILRIGVQIASGLEAAHAQGVVHRDVKPSNILVEKTVERVLLTDFGLARVADDATLTRTGVVTGTPHYMSPEQSTGEAIDQRSDLFSLGSVLYFMATGHPPFRAERAIAVLNRISHEPHRPAWDACEEMPDQLSDIIDRLLAKKPRDRFSTAAEVRGALSNLLAEIQQPTKRRLRSRTRYGRWLQRNRYLVVISVLSVATLLGSYPFLLESTKSGERSPTESFVRTSIEHPSVLAAIVAQELQLLYEFTGIESTSLDDLRAALVPFIDEECKRHPNLQNLAPTDPLNGPLLLRVAKVAEPFVRHEEKYSSYLQDVQSRYAFYRKTTSQRLLLELDALVGLDVDQWPAIRERFGSLYEDGRNLSSSIGECELQSEDLDDLLTEQQCATLGKLFSVRALVLEKAESPEQASYEQLFRSLLREAGLAQAAQLSSELELSNSQCKEVDVFWDNVIKATLASLPSDSDSYDFEDLIVSERLESSPQSMKMLSLASNPAQLFATQLTGWEELLGALLNNHQTQILAANRTQRIQLNREVLAHQIVQNFGTGFQYSLTSKQCIATQDLVKSLVRIPPLGAVGTERLDALYGGLLELPDHSFIEAMGKQNWSVFGQSLKLLQFQLNASKPSS